jgi:hypothetical protein
MASSVSALLIVRRQLLDGHVMTQWEAELRIDLHRPPHERILVMCPALCPARETWRERNGEVAREWSGMEQSGVVWSAPRD